MRFQIKFELQGEGPFEVPVHYHNEFASWIFKVLHFGDEEFSRWLQSQGYLDSQKEYKLFTYSDVSFGDYKVQGDRLVIARQNAEMLISFYATPEIEPYVYKLFKDQEFRIGDSKGKVTVRIVDVVKLGDPELQLQEVFFTCISPMLISDASKGNAIYLSPEDKGFDKVFMKSLMAKYANLIKLGPDKGANGLSNLQDLAFKLHGKPKGRIIKIKTDTPHQKTLKGYVFDFSLKAPESLLKIGYLGGFGEMNHLGFGCCEIQK